MASREEQCLTPALRTGNLRAAVIMIGASAIIAFTSLLAKALGQGVGWAGGDPAAALHPLQVSAGRFFFAFLVVSIAFAWARPGFIGTRWRVHAGRSLCGWMGATCLFAAAARMPLADATAISFLSPLVTMALAIVLLGERVGPIRWMAAGISVAGAVILIRPGMEAFQPAALIALAAAAFMGLEAILIKTLSGAEPAIRILFINNAIGATVSLAAALTVWTTPSAEQWAMLAVLGVTMVGAQALFIQALKVADASYVIPFFYATLLFAALYDFTLFGELPDGLGALGAAIIVAGALLLAWRERVHQRRAAISRRTAAR